VRAYSICDMDFDCIIDYCSRYIFYLILSFIKIEIIVTQIFENKNNTIFFIRPFF